MRTAWKTASRSCAAYAARTRVEAHSRLRILLMALSTLVAASSGRPVEVEASTEFISTGQWQRPDAFVSNHVLDGLDVQDVVFWRDA